MTTRHPAKIGTFSWGRIVHESGAVTYRLFRRDRRNRVHMAIVVFQPGDSCRWRAQLLRRKYRDLRDQVDEVDLALMGIAA